MLPVIMMRQYFSSGESLLLVMDCHYWQVRAASRVVSGLLPQARGSYGSAMSQWRRLGQKIDDCNLGEDGNIFAPKSKNPDPASDRSIGKLHCTCISTASIIPF